MPLATLHHVSLLGCLSLRKLVLRLSATGISRSEGEWWLDVPVGRCDYLFPRGGTDADL